MIESVRMRIFVYVALSLLPVAGIKGLPLLQGMYQRDVVEKAQHPTTISTFGIEQEKLNRARIAYRPRGRLAEDIVNTVAARSAPTRGRGEPGSHDRGAPSAECLDSVEVPEPVLAAIADEARRNHPDDYSTQLFLVKRQIEAYKALAVFSEPADIPSDVISSIRSTVRANHPGDYSTQLFLIKRQSAAYRTLTSTSMVVPANGPNDVETTATFKDNSQLRHDAEQLLNKMTSARESHLDELNRKAAEAEDEVRQSRERVKVLERQLEQLRRNRRW